MFKIISKIIFVVLLVCWVTYIFSMGLCSILPVDSNESFSPNPKRTGALEQDVIRSTTVTTLRKLIFFSHGSTRNISTIRINTHRIQRGLENKSFINVTVVLQALITSRANTQILQKIFKVTLEM